MPQDMVGLLSTALFLCAAIRWRPAVLPPRQRLWFVPCVPFRTQSKGWLVQPGFSRLRKCLAGVPCVLFVCMRLVIFVHLCWWFFPELDIIIQETLFHVANT